VRQRDGRATGARRASTTTRLSIVTPSSIDTTNRERAPSDGTRLIPIQTPKGEFRVWTRRIGDNPRIKVLLLHGGPGASDESFEGCETWFAGAGIEFIYYDQLGSFRSDQPDDPDLWELSRFVEEVEQVRVALGLDAANFYLLGHSWGGILAIEYALTYGQHLKALVVSNMMSSCPAYNAYAREVLEPAMDPAALAEIRRLEAAGEFEDPRYMELLMEQHYVHHVLRMPPDAWPGPVNRTFAHINQSIYVLMQGPSELGLSGRLVEWDRTADLGSITAPTLVIGATHDTMDPAYMEMMAGRFPRGEFLLCPDGSHMAMWDDERTWFEGLIGFIRRVDARAERGG